MKRFQTNTHLNERQLTEIKSVFIRVAYVGFLDLIFRFSYAYLGLLSYTVRLLGFISLFIVPGLPYNVLKSIFKYMTVICNIVLAWILTSTLMTQEEGEELSPFVFIILKLGQFCLVFTYYYICNVNTIYRFLFHTYIFFIGGSVLQICPYWISNILMTISGYLAAVFFFRMNNIGTRIFSVEQIRQLVLHIQGFNNMQSEDILKALDRKDFIIYFAILLPVIFTFNSLIASSDTDQLHWILTSTLGMCCSTVISVKVFGTTVIFVFKQTVKLSYFLIKGENNFTSEQLLLTEYITTVYLFTSDLFIYNIEPFERGVLLTSRILLLTACLLEANFLVVEAVCSETDIVRGNLRTSLKVIGMHLCFSFSSIVILFKLLALYPMSDLGIFLTVSIFCCNIVRTLFSFVTFVLYKIDVMRQEFWENFDDVVFYTRLAQSVVFISICVGTACFAVWTLFFGVYMWIDLFRLLALCHVNIFSEIGTLQNVIKQRRKIVQFTSELDDASDVQIRENEDACPICLQEMVKAKMTSCKHIFHEVCLRKWLNVRLFCPLCKNDIALQ